MKQIPPLSHPSERRQHGGYLSRYLNSQCHSITCRHVSRAIKRVTREDHRIFYQVHAPPHLEENQGQQLLLEVDRPDAGVSQGERQRITCGGSDGVSSEQTVCEHTEDLFCRIRISVTIQVRDLDVHIIMSMMMDDGELIVCRLSEALQKTSSLSFTAKMFEDVVHSEIEETEAALFCCSLDAQIPEDHSWKYVITFVIFMMISVAVFYVTI